MKRFVAVVPAGAGVFGLVDDFRGGYLARACGIKSKR